jgi:hypothetical protein
LLIFFRFHVNLRSFTNILDYGISREEFLRIRQDEFYQQFGLEMSADDIEAANLRFKLTDADSSGFIDWDEYLNYECMRKLHRTPAV